AVGDHMALDADDRCVDDRRRRSARQHRRIAGRASPGGVDRQERGGAEQRKQHVLADESGGPARRRLIGAWTFVLSTLNILCASPYVPVRSKCTTCAADHARSTCLVSLLVSLGSSRRQRANRSRYFFLTFATFGAITTEQYGC